MLGASDGIDQVYDTVTITVSKPTFDIAVTTAGNGTVAPSGTQKISTGGDLSITGQPAAGYGFSEWTVTGGLTIANPKDSATKILNVQGPGTVTAHFVRMLKITVQSDKRGVTVPSGDVFVKENEYLSISASCGAAFMFLKWTRVSGNVEMPDSLHASTQIGPITNPGIIKAQFTARGMRLIPKGSYRDSLGYLGAITHDFFMDTTEVTKAEWNEITTKNDTNLLLPQRSPWDSVIIFCNSLSKLRGLDTVYTYDGWVGDSLVNVQCNWNAVGYRLPTEDEWEYSCRAGSTTTYFWGDNWYLVADDYAWYKFSSLGNTHEVATKKPNAWGLYDMAGNLDEWCWDGYDYDIAGYIGYRPTTRTDYRGPGSGQTRIFKGADYSSEPTLLKSSARVVSPGRYPQGFRLVLRDPGD